MGYDAQPRSAGRGRWLWLIVALMAGLMAGWMAFHEPASTVQAPPGDEIPSLNQIPVK
jgi:hypothetical protein